MEVWIFTPQAGFTESLEWLTEVIRCKGAEQRISLRPKARKSYFYEYLLDSSSLARAKFLARFSGSVKVLVPGWEYRSLVRNILEGSETLPINTLYFPVEVGTRVIILQETLKYEVRTVTGYTEDSISLDLPMQSYDEAHVMPLYECSFAQEFEATRGTSYWARCQVRFLTTDVVSLEGTGLAPDHPQYMNHDVLLDRTVLISTLRERHSREFTTFDNTLGEVWNDAEYNYPISTTQIGWSVDGPEQLWPIRAWLDELRGKWRGFWLPSWNQDLVLSSPVFSSDTILSVRNTGYHLYQLTGDIMVLTNSGDTYFRKVVSSSVSEENPSIELLTLDSSLGVSLGLSQVEMICTLSFMRLDSDRVEIKHSLSRRTDIMVPVMETPLP